MLRPFFHTLRYWQSFTTRRDQYNALHFDLSPQADYSSTRQHLSNIISSHAETTLWVHLRRYNLAFAQPLITELNFQIHHGIADRLSLCLWMNRNTPNKIIPYSRCFLSCGAVVIRNNHLLLIEEKFGARKGQFGIPGGRSDFTEDIKSCAERQLFEETGLKASFNKILFIRELEKYTYDAYDVYFVCLMKQLINPQGIKLCPDEIASSVWVPLKELKTFMENRSVGTQKYLSKYLSQLYQQGYNFENQNSFHETFKIRLKPNAEEKTVVQHFIAK